MMVRAIAHKTEIKMGIIYLGTLDDLRNPSLHQQHHDIQTLFDPYLVWKIRKLHKLFQTACFLISHYSCFSTLGCLIFVVRFTVRFRVNVFNHRTQHGSTENSVNPCQQLLSCYTLRRCISCGTAAWHQRSTASIVAAVPAVAWESGSTAFVC